MSKPKSKPKVAPIDQVLATPGLSPAALQRLKALKRAQVYSAKHGIDLAARVLKDRES